MRSSIQFSTNTEERILNNDPELSGVILRAENDASLGNMLMLRLARALTVNTVVTCLELSYMRTSFSHFNRDDLGVFMEVLRTRPFAEICLLHSRESGDQSVAWFLRAIQQNPSQPLCFLYNCVIQPETIQFFPPKVVLINVRLPAGVHDSQIVDMVATNSNLSRLEFSVHSPSFIIPCIQGTMNHPGLLELSVRLDLFEKEHIVDLIGILSATIRAPKCALKQLMLGNWNWKLEETYPITLAVHENKTIESIEFKSCHLHSNLSVMFDSLPLCRHLSLIECESNDPDVLTHVFGHSRGLGSVTCKFTSTHCHAPMLKGLFQGLKHRASSVRKLDLQGIALDDIALVADTMGSIQIEELSLTFSHLGWGNREASEAAIKSGFCRNAWIVRCDLASLENPISDTWAPFILGWLQLLIGGVEETVSVKKPPNRLVVMLHSPSCSMRLTQT